MPRLAVVSGLRRVSSGLALVLAAVALTACSDDDPPREQPGARTEASPSPSDASDPKAAARPSRGPTRPHSAKQALRLLVAAEAAIDDPATDAKALVAAARTQQLVYRELGAHPGWDATVLGGVPPRLHSVVRANVASRREFRAMHSVLSDELPAWRIVAPAPAEDLLRFYKEGERAYGIGWEYLAAINLVETGMGRIRGTSVAGAQGPMQFLPTTWAKWGRGDIQDPGDSIMAAARYLAHDGGARPGRLDDALFRYNNSNNYVRGVTHLAKVMERRPRAFYGYYHWDIYYLTSRGDVRLPVGYDRDHPVPVEKWLATHPQQ